MFKRHLPSLPACAGKTQRPRKETSIQETIPVQAAIPIPPWRDHFQREELNPAAPDRPLVDIARIHNSDNVLGLVLAFHISVGLAARKTAFVLRTIFQIPISYQTVLNYTEAAAFYCHRFNLHNKGSVDSFQAGDETYIKIAGRHAYTFFFISVRNHKITAYHLASDRSTLPATVALREAIRTSRPDQCLEFITDGNPSYQAALHFLNSQRNKDLSPMLLHPVIGLQNLDSESETYREFKQMIERLNRTYKSHTRAACGFNTSNGACSLTTLFVTHYNFLRPHTALYGTVPIPLAELDDIPTLQAKWCKILDMSIDITSSPGLSQLV